MCRRCPAGSAVGDRGLPQFEQTALFPDSDLRERDQVRPSRSTAVYGQLEHGAGGGTATFGRAAGIENPHALEPLHLWHVGMAVDDCRAVGENVEEPCLPPWFGAWCMCDAYADAADADHVLLWQGRPQLSVVRVPENGFHGWSEGSQLLKRFNGTVVAGVEDEICHDQAPNALLRKPARPTRKVSVANDRKPCVRHIRPPADGSAREGYATRSACPVYATRSACPVDVGHSSGEGKNLETPRWSGQLRGSVARARAARPVGSLRTVQ